MAVTVRLHFVPQVDKASHQTGEALRDQSLDKERRFHSALVEDRQNEIHVPDDPLGDRGVEVDAGLVPVLDVDGESRYWFAAVAGMAQAGNLHPKGRCVRPVDRHVPGDDTRRVQTQPASIEQISVVIPMLNEAHNVERLVFDLAAQDFRGAIEVLVADGGSTDGSVKLLRTHAERAGLAITIVENPDRLVAHGLNRCIGLATGELIVRLDCKSHYPADYLRRSAIASEETGAWTVGGLLLTSGRTRTERAVGCAMASPFGGLGWTRRAGAQRVEVDTVYLGAFRPEVFRRVGTFDPAMGDNHDEELNLRVREAGGRVVSDPAIRAYYTPPSSFERVFARYFSYGFYKVPVMLKHRRIVTLRSLAPVAFLTSAVLLAPGALRFERARRMLAAELGLYAVAGCTFGAASIWQQRERWALLPRVVAVFPTFHLAYALGMTEGLRRAAVKVRARSTATRAR
jgi:succinoglycan biosynthesis protein ExoA